MYRSFLFAPGDSERKIAKAEQSGADVVIIDLEDSVAPVAKLAARRLTAGRLIDSRASARQTSVFVRINPLGTPEALEDLVAVMPGRPDGIMLPKASSAEEVRSLGLILEALEVQNGLARGSTVIIPVATETPQAVFALGSYASAGPRLTALTWGAEDLSAAVGAIANRRGDDWTQPYQVVRTLCLFAAAAASVPAIDTLFADFRDEQGLIESASQARRDGFSGKLAIHPAQVAAINAAFSPTPDEVERARQIVALFEQTPAVGVVALDGKMLDRPHLIAAQKILAMATR
jgi:citrate lyase subunit beta/citryl-CoA lyase